MNLVSELIIVKTTLIQKHGALNRVQTMQLNYLERIGSTSRFGYES